MSGLTPYRILMFAFGFSLGTTVAQAADWTVFNNCMRGYLAPVDAAEPSILSGATLIVRVLCVEESANLANALVSENPNAVRDHGSYGEAFSSFLTVMERDTALELFQVRRSKLEH